MDKKTEVNQRATKKNRKRAVQKWIMAIVAASMVASMVAGVVAPAVSAKAEPQAPAQTETPKKKGTPVGTWYGKIFGMSVVLNLKDGGAYCIDFEGRNEETGTWIMDGDNVITDKGDNSETTYIFNGDSLITKVKGAKMKLTKDEDVYSSESDKTPNKNADESDFNRIVVTIMVASMVAGVVAPAVSAKAEPQAPAQTETPKKKGTPVGTWYGKIFGMSVVLNLKDGGAYCIDFEGRNEETGTWIMDGDNVITDKGDNSETTYIFNGDSLITKVKGAKMKLTKDEDASSSESDKTPNKNADESDFNGVWEADSVSIGKLSAEPSTFGIASAFLNIKNKKVDIYIDNISSNNPIQADEMDGSFENGTLTCAIENNDKPFILDMVSLNDKTIICTLRTDDYEMQLNMKKSTEKELKKAKKMAAASEQKSKKNADSGSEPDTDNYIDSDGTSTAKTKDIKPGTAGAAAHTN